MMVLFNLSLQKMQILFKDFQSDLAGNLVRILLVAINKFNEYYMNIEKSCHNFKLCNATAKTIKRILSCLNASKATGLERISSKFLKGGAQILPLPLCNLVNFLIKQSLFLDQCKIAKLKALFKKGSKSDTKKLQVHLIVTCCV